MGVSDGSLNTCLNRLDTIGLGARDLLADLANIAGPELGTLVALTGQPELMHYWQKRREHLLKDWTKRHTFIDTLHTIHRKRD